MIRKFLFFFPVQLFLVNLKRNHLLLIFWLILFGITGEHLVERYGIPYLFLAPEYLGSISFWSYFIMSFFIGSFVMSFNITSYIINSLRFPFVAALKRPFVRYCINNSMLPLLFLTFYIVKVIIYHLENENSSSTEILIYVIGILSGYISNIMISLTYFFSTNKNIFKKLGITPDTDNGKPINSLLMRDENLYNFLKKRESWHVESYLYSPFKVKLARDISHYDKKMLKSVFDQNHINASIFELVIFTTFIIIGLLSENPLFLIPAGASVMLFFTMILILSSAFYTWLKGWTSIVFIGLFVLINFLSKKQIFNYSNMAYGLNYETEKAEYTLEKLNEFRYNSENIQQDKENSLTILNNWKAKNAKKDKPKLIFINTSGGGARSTLWTFHTLHYINNYLHGSFFRQVHLITGSSGGMVGAAYYRELYLKQRMEEIYHFPMADNCVKVSRDLLNPIALTIATNDFFIRMKKYDDGKYSYTKDRGYAFERQLIINTDYCLDKRMMDYHQPEFESEIPMMMFSPSIINDGRRLLISAQPISFLADNSTGENTQNHPISENVEFMRLFKDQDAANLRFTSAIRMSATFPYIMPSVSLPSEPQINVMDAGMRDNYGALTTFKYMNTFKEWIDENTSGVIIIRLIGKQKERKIKENPLRSITETFFSPLESLYSNLFSIQNYSLDDMIQYLETDIKQPIDIIDFELEDENETISLSWHLTTKEKEKILSSTFSENNQKSIKRLKKLID